MTSGKGIDSLFVFYGFHETSRSDAILVFLLILGKCLTVVGVEALGKKKSTAAALFYVAFSISMIMIDATPEACNGACGERTQWNTLCVVDCRKSIRLHAGRVRVRETASGRILPCFERRSESDHKAVL